MITEDATPAELIGRGHDRVRAFSWDDTARARSCRATAAWPETETRESQAQTAGPDRVQCRTGDRGPEVVAA